MSRFKVDDRVRVRRAKGARWSSDGETSSTSAARGAVGVVNDPRPDRDGDIFVSWDNPSFVSYARECDLELESETPPAGEDPDVVAARLVMARVGRVISEAGRLLEAEADCSPEAIDRAQVERGLWKIFCENP